MGKFQFRLASPLKWRRECERQAKLAFQEALVAQAQIENEMEKVAKEIEKWIGVANELSVGKLEVDRIILIERYVNMLHDRYGQLKEELVRRIQAVETAREAWRIAERECKKLEYLKDKHLAEYNSAQSMLVQKISDDLVSSKIWREQNGW